MPFPQIGVEAVLVLSRFEDQARKYQADLTAMQKKTEDVALRIGNAMERLRGAKMGSEEYAQAYSELAGLRDEEAALAQENSNLAMSFGDPIQMALRLATTAYQVGEALYNLSEQATVVTNAARSFAALSAQSGVMASELLRDLQDISNGEVATADLIIATNRALLAGGATFYQDLPRIFEIAESVARASGGNTVAVYEQLIQAIVTGMPKQAQSAGLFLGGKDVLEAYAASINKTVEALNAQERSEAVRLAVLQKGEGAIRATAAAGKDASETFDQVKATWANLTSGMGVLFAPVAERINAGLQTVMLGLRGATGSLAGFGNVIRSLKDILAGTTTVVEAFGVGFSGAFNILETGIQPVADLATGIEQVADAEDETIAKTDELAKKLEDLTAQRLEKMNALQKQWADKDVDTAIQRARQLEDAERQLGYQLEDAARAYNKNRDRIYKDNGKRIADIERDNVTKLAEFERDAQKQREDQAQDHAERLRQINQSYYDTVDEAARKNDAVAVAQAMRQRARELRDETITNVKERTELDENLSERRQKLAEDYELQKQAEQARLQEQLQALEEQRAADDENLRIHLERQKVERDLAWARQDADFQLAKERQLRDLDDWYAQEQEKLGVHLAAMTAIAVAAVAEAGQAIATTASAAAATIATLPSTVWGNRHDYLGSETTPTGKTSDAWGSRHNYFAEGGAIVTDKPTTVTMGEAGRELGVFVPERKMSVMLGGRGTIGFDNIPQGVTSQQAQDLAYRAVANLIEGMLRAN